jgi:hypothetical protein
MRGFIELQRCPFCGRLVGLVEGELYDPGSSVAGDGIKRPKRMPHRCSTYVAPRRPARPYATPEDSTDDDR